MHLNPEQEEIPIRTPFFYGWVIVFISALGVFFSGPGQTYSVSVFIDSFIEDLGWTRSLVSLLYSLGTLMAGLTVTFVGREFDRRGHRIMMPLVALFFGFALLWMSFIINPVMLLFGFYLIRLLGQSSMVIGPSTLVPKWFEDRRGRALSIMSIGIIAGAAGLPPLNTWIINTWGWRHGWRFWAVLLWVIMVPLSRFLVRNNPRDVGLKPDGLTAGKADEEPGEELGENRKANPSAPSVTLAEARKMPAFWLLLYCMFVPSMVGTGVTFHIVSILGERGLSAGVAATTLSTIALMSFPSTLLAGHILDRIRVRHTMVVIFSLYSLNMVWLINTGNAEMALIYGIFQGMIMGLHRVNINMIWPSYFGLEHLGSIRGAVQIAFVLGAACGPFPIGLAYDYFGGYMEILWLMAVFPVLSIIASYFAVSPTERNQKRD